MECARSVQAQGGMGKSLRIQKDEDRREREREREEYRAGDRSTEINIEGSLAAGPRG